MSGFDTEELENTNFLSDDEEDQEIGNEVDQAEGVRRNKDGLPEPDYLTGFVELQGFMEDCMAFLDVDEELEDNEEFIAQKESELMEVLHTQVMTVSNPSKDRMKTVVGRIFGEYLGGEYLLPIADQTKGEDIVASVLENVVPAVVRLFLFVDHNTPGKEEETEEGQEPEDDWWTGTGFIVTYGSVSEISKKYLIASSDCFTSNATGKGLKFYIEAGYYGKEGDAVDRVLVDTQVYPFVPYTSLIPFSSTTHEKLVIIDLSTHPACPILPAYDLSQREAHGQLDDNVPIDDYLHLSIGHPLGYAKRVTFGRGSAQHDNESFPHYAPVFFGSNGSLVLSFPIAHRSNKHSGSSVHSSAKLFVAGVHVASEHDEEEEVQDDENSHKHIVYSLFY